MTAGFVSEISPGERRVAMAPSAISVFNKTGIELVMEAGSGVAAGFPDKDYSDKGVRVLSRAEVFAAADAIRDGLAARGVLLEDSAGMTRWKRK